LFTALLHGFVLALGLILPLGAQNVFVFNQGASQPNTIRALPVVITASLCDTLLILLAVLGISVVILTVPWLQTLIFSIGFLFLLYMGWSIWKSSPPSAGENKESMTPKKQILFALSVSLLNPHAILDTIGVIGTSSLHYKGAEKAAFTLSCISVSWFWFIFLAVVGKFVGQLDLQRKLIRLLNKISAIIIWGVAVYIARELFQLFF
jgi:L-lysine exporter family protein LysE/ArgO